MEKSLLVPPLNGNRFFLNTFDDLVSIHFFLLVPSAVALGATPPPRCGWGPKTARENQVCGGNVGPEMSDTGHGGPRAGAGRPAGALGVRARTAIAGQPSAATMFGPPAPVLPAPALPPSPTAAPLLAAAESPPQAVLRLAGLADAQALRQRCSVDVDVGDGAGLMRATPQGARLPALQCGQ